MTRILHIISSADLKGGGPIEVVRNLDAAWARAGHVQDLLTLDPPGCHEDLPGYNGTITARGPQVSRLPWDRYGRSPAFVAWLRDHVRQYDGVIVSGLWRYQVAGTLAGLRGSNVPVFVFTHGMLDPWFKQTYPLKHLGKQASWWLAEGRLLRSAAKVLFTCEEERILAQDAFWPYRVNPAVVGCGIEDVAGDAEAQMAAFRAAVPALGDRRFLLFLSRIHEKKGVDLLVEAFGRVAADHRDVDLVVAGPDQSGLVASLKAIARRHGVEERIHFPGMLYGDQKFGAFRAADAFALSSHQENFGIVVAEALACGTPVLISNKVNIWREIEADAAGLVQPDTPEGTLALLRGWLEMETGARQTMRDQARSTFLHRFQIEGVAQRLMTLIEDHRPPQG